MKFEAIDYKGVISPELSVAPRHEIKLNFTNSSILDNLRHVPFDIDNTIYCSILDGIIALYTKDDVLIGYVRYYPTSRLKSLVEFNKWVNLVYINELTHYLLDMKLQPQLLAIHNMLYYYEMKLDSFRNIISLDVEYPFSLRDFIINNKILHRLFYNHEREYIVFNQTNYWLNFNYICSSFLGDYHETVMNKDTEMDIRGYIAVVSRLITVNKPEGGFIILNNRFNQIKKLIIPQT